MQVSVEHTGQLERKLRIVVPEEQIEAEVQNRLRSLSRTTRIQGFRPGKAPMKIVQKHYGLKIRNEVIGELIQSSFYEAVNKEKLRPASMPDISQAEIEQEDGLAFTATFEIFPEVELAPIENLKVEKVVCNVTDEDLDKMVEVLRKQQRKLEPVDRAAKHEDVLKIDFTGRIDGELFEGGESKDLMIELGAGRFIDGFEDGLIGVKSGEEKKLKLKFPDDYHKDDYAGKPVEFEVIIKEINQQILPELDEKFFSEMGVKEAEVDAFRNEVRGNMLREVEKVSLEKAKNTVMDALYEANKIDLPESMVTNEAKRLQQQLMENLERQGIKASDLPDEKPDAFREQAEKRVSLQLIVSEIVKVNTIKVDPVKVREMIEKVAQSYQQPDEVINWYYSDKNRLAEVEALALEDEIVDWVLNKAQVTEKELAFDALMNKGQTEHD